VELLCDSSNQTFFGLKDDLVVLQTEVGRSSDLFLRMTVHYADIAGSKRKCFSIFRRVLTVVEAMLQVQILL